MTHQRARRLATVAALSAALVLGGCATAPATQDLCSNANNLSTAVEQVRTLKPDGQKIDALTAKVDAALARLDQFQAVTEGRFDSAVSTLRANLDSFRQALAAAGNDAFTAAAPQLSSSLKDVSSAYAALNESLATQCPAG
jgi:outer membrane murein-binding lipoprotein Lpp